MTDVAICAMSRVCVHSSPLSTKMRRPTLPPSARPISSAVVQSAKSGRAWLRRSSSTPERAKSARVTASRVSSSRVVAGRRGIFLLKDQGKALVNGADGGIRQRTLGDDDIAGVVLKRLDGARADGDIGEG